jgi:hypothetical protein
MVAEVARKLRREERGRGEDGVVMASRGWIVSMGIKI